MKGVIFNIFESFVNTAIGADAWDSILDEAKMESEVFIGPKTYDDSVLMKLVGTCINKYKLPAEGAIRSFGKFTLPHLMKKVPDVVGQFKSPEELLLNLDGIIHVEVRKLMEEAQPPKFIVSQNNDGSLDVEYISKRNLCILVEGLVEGLAEHYSKNVDYEQVCCCLHGDASCKFKIQFKNKG